MVEIGGSRRGWPLSANQREITNLSRRSHNQGHVPLGVALADASDNAKLARSVPAVIEDCPHFVVAIISHQRDRFRCPAV